MSEKPQKRLVGWAHYIGNIAEKAKAYAVGTVCGGVGLAFLLIAAFICWGIFYLWPSGGDKFITLILAGAFATMGFVAIYAGKTKFSDAKKIEHVVPITPQNAKYLPEVETLIRASGLPASHQQAELLRAAPHGSETSPEELLRAATNRQVD